MNGARDRRDGRVVERVEHTIKDAPGLRRFLIPKIWVLSISFGYLYLDRMNKLKALFCFPSLVT